MIVCALTLRNIEVISHHRDKLRIAGKLTDCENRDHIIIAMASMLKELLLCFIQFGDYIGHVIHAGQNVDLNKPLKFTKCLNDWHMFKTCDNNWVCKKWLTAILNLRLMIRSMM